MSLRFVLLVFLYCGTTPSSADIISGKVIAVSDGDTLTIIKNKYKFKIRLRGIDSPELDQPHGDNAKKALADLVYNKTVEIRFDNFDDYKRVLGTVYLDQLNVNSEMIKNGHAWVYRKYTKDKFLYNLEDIARKNKQGLWALPVEHRIPPWEWRHRK